MIISKRKNGRLCNILLRDLILFIIGEKNKHNIQFEFNIGSKHEKIEKCINFMKEIGLYNLFKKREKGNLHTINSEEGINEKQLLQCLNKSFKFDKNKKYIFSKGYLQSNDFIIQLTKYLISVKNRLIKEIEINNKFKNRYNKNNDLFIHIRNGDIFNTRETILTPNFNYYRKVLELNKYDNIYLTLADKRFKNKNDELKFKNLIKEYNIKIFEDNEANTILFGSTCKYICMSSGSFSLMIGLFGYYSKYIYYSANAGKIFFTNNKLVGWHNNYYSTLKNINDKFIEINL